MDTYVRQIQLPTLLLPDKFYYTVFIEKII